MVIWEQSPYVDNLLRFAAHIAVTVKYPDNEVMRELAANNEASLPPGFKIFFRASMKVRPVSQSID